MTNSQPQQQPYFLKPWFVAGCTALLAIVLAIAGPTVMIFANRPSQSQNWLLAAIYCATISIVTEFWASGEFALRFPVASVLLKTTWRMMAVAGVAAISAATKWTEHNFFCLTLVGCYFPFLVLESAFSLARVLHLSRR